MKSYMDLVNEAKAGLGRVTAPELKDRLDGGEDILLIDVREAEEWAVGLIPGAHPVPRGVLEGQVDRVPRDTTVVLYCAGGFRSALAGKSLQEMGFTEVENLEGGFGAWASAGLPVEHR